MRPGQHSGLPLQRQPLPGVWTRLAGLPTPRSKVAVAELNGRIYVFGGFDGRWGLVADV